MTFNAEAVTAVSTALIAEGYSHDEDLVSLVAVLAISRLLDTWANASDLCQGDQHDPRWCIRCAALEDGFTEAAARLRSISPDTDRSAA